MKQIFNLKSYLTFLSRNKVYTAINVFGLSVSLMFVILLVVFVQQEYTVDTQHSKLDRIYLFAHHGSFSGTEDDGKVTAFSNRGFGPELLKRIPDIEQFCAITYYPDQKLKLSSGQTFLCNELYVDTTFYQVFDFDLIAGDKTIALREPDNAVISEDFARRLFGEGNPVGRRIERSDSVVLTVSGLFRSMGNTSVTQDPDIIRSNYYLIKRDRNYTNYNNQLGTAEPYLLAKPNVDLQQQTTQIYEVLKEISPTFFNSDVWKMEPDILPLRSLYLSEVESNMGRRGDVKMVKIFAFVALIVLLFAVMNYVNLTVAQSGYRAREMASRRLFGAQRADIVLKLIAESVSLSLISLAIGVGLAVWLAPYVGKMLNTSLLMERLLLPSNISSILGGVLLIGVLAGIIPAVIQSRAKPIEVVRGTFRRTTKMLFSRVFIVIQNVITIALIAAALTIFFQIRHMVNAPLGYDHHGVMMVFNPFYWEEADSTSASTFGKELAKLPCVELVSSCSGAPVMSGQNGYKLNGQQYWICPYRIDENWMKLLGIEVEEDYHQAQREGWYVNRSLMGQLGLKPDARDWLPNGENNPNDLKREPLLGVISDFHISDINNHRFDGAAIAVCVSPTNDMSHCWLIKVKGDEQEAYHQVSALYKQVFKDEWVPDKNMPYLDQWLEDAYESQQRLLNVVALFAAIAVLISLMGLIAMSTYFIQQRRKEIAIRKVYGSTSRQIWSSLVRTFLLYVGIAFVIAAPIVWHYMGDWLSEFNYRIQLWPWILVAGFACFIISFAAVFIQSFLASNENPINHIKDNG